MTEKRYGVKTRNWHCRKSIFHLIAIIPHQRGDSYSDGDGKFWFESNNKLIALTVWFYWWLLSHWSGGWTYIIDQQKYPAGISKTKTFYL